MNVHSSAFGVITVILTACLALLRSLTASAADELRTLPTGALFDRGRACLSDPAKADSALIYYTAIIDRYEHDMSPDGRQNLARAYNNRGYVWEYARYDYRKATQDLLKSLDLCESMPSPIRTEAFVCLNLANIFDNYANHQEEPERYRKRAMEYWTRSMEVARRLKEWEIMLRSFIPLATVSISKADTPEGRAHLHELSARFKESGIPNGIPMVGFCRTRADALQALSEGNLRQAADLFRRESSLIDTDIAPERYEIDSYNSLATTYHMLGNRDSVARYIRLIEEIIDRHDLKELRPLLTRTKINYLSPIPTGLPADSLQSNLESETDSIMRGLKLEKISDIYLEKRD